MIIKIAFSTATDTILKIHLYNIKIYSLYLNIFLLLNDFHIIADAFLEVFIII
jgi:hypothetical protein